MSDRVAHALRPRTRSECRCADRPAGRSEQVEGAHDSNYLAQLLDLEPASDPAIGRVALDPAGGKLADIAPTLLGLMDLPQPDEMTGRNLATLGG